MAKKIAWNAREEAALADLLEKGLSMTEIARKLNRTQDSVALKAMRLRRSNPLFGRVPESPFPKWDQPLTAEGDALILTDVEAPYHHAEFINRCLDLADAWKVENIVFAGDLLHFDSLSSWGAEWVPEEDANLASLVEWINTLPMKQREVGLGLINSVGDGGGGLSDELEHGRAVFRSFSSFTNKYVCLGNHDDRYLRALDKALKPRELLVQLDVHHRQGWQIAPYYYTKIETEGGLYRAEHPRGASRSAAQDLAVQYHCHIVMGHSHRWAVNLDPSGKYWAIQTGHCVDEERLAYVQQRSAKRDAHSLGATIIRGGYPFVLRPVSPWALLKKM